MYSKDELSAKSVVQLKDIAKEIGAKIKSGDNKETIIYTILDAQAEGPTDDAAPKRKRTRIASKKEDRVYSVNGTDGENFDVMKNQATGPVDASQDAAPQGAAATADPQWCSWCRGGRSYPAPSDVPAFRCSAGTHWGSAPKEPDP